MATGGIAALVVVGKDQWAVPPVLRQNRAMRQFLCKMVAYDFKEDGEEKVNATSRPYSVVLP
jgi:hypothetical protein